MWVIFILYTKYYETKENVMDGAYSYIINGRRNAYRNLVRRVHSEHLGVDGRIILKRALEK
jgi:hypothetical protein